MPFDVREAELVARGLTPPEATKLAAAAKACAGAEDDEVAQSLAWQTLCQGRLLPQMPFAVHRYVYDVIFAKWPVARGPRPAWQPGARESNSRVRQLMRQQGKATVAELHAWSVQEPEAFWGWALQALRIRFAAPPSRVLDDSMGPEHARWLPDAQLNIVNSCFTADAARDAILWQEPGRALARTTYGELAALTAQVAAALPAHGFAPGDAVAICMPMTPESVAIYLGIVAAGMVVVSIADSMAPDEIATRLRIAHARGIFTVDDVMRGGKRLRHLEKVLAAHPPRAVVLGAGALEGLRPADLRWSDFIAASASQPAFAPVVAKADAPTNILFSSGTTGDPKAIPWTHLTPIKAATDAALALDVREGDVVAWPTNLGWMMGPWLIYAALLNGATIALYADAPTAKDFGRFVQDARVNVLGLVPSIVKAWRSDDRMVGFDWSAIKCFGSTGEASNADDYLYLMMLAGYRPVIEYCGGTEIGGGYITGTLAQPASPATFTTPAFGSDFLLLDERGAPTDNGEVFLVPPTLGYSQSLLNRSHHEVYFEGTPSGPAGQVLRRHGDQIERLPGGFFRAHGRVDDTMNLGGIKVSSAEIERVLDGVPGVSRTAAIAVSPPGGGPSLLVIYAVASFAKEALLPRLQEAIKTRLNPLFRISDVVIIDAMPVTASNKIMRRELRARYPADAT